MSEEIKLSLDVNTESFVSEINERLDTHLMSKQITLKEFAEENKLSLEMLQDLMGNHILPEKTEDLMKILCALWVTPVLLLLKATWEDAE